MVSYQGNRDVPGFRWLKYKEGFSLGLIEHLIEMVRPLSVLDPFSGIGTTPIVAVAKGLQATGIEILPVAALAGRGISLASNDLDGCSFQKAASRLVQHVQHRGHSPSEHAFPHVRITESAFPLETESELARAREFIGGVTDTGIRDLLNLACMSVLESVSYTRKDGQYLRWDHRSGRPMKVQAKKGEVLRFVGALSDRLEEMVADIKVLQSSFRGGELNLIEGSSLDLLRDLPNSSFDTVVTSPPYANRYDYTRTYALELAWLGFSHEAFKSLRQTLLSATVENKSKVQSLLQAYSDSALIHSAIQMYDEQLAVREVVSLLKEHVGELSNPHIIRLIEGYFLEMAVVVAELARIVQPGGTVIIVNDNVQYHGEELPVDLILCDYAEQCGFTCEDIWILPRRKGNASQQMGRFGRRVLRKCVYRWVRGDS